jgi:DNA helicase II / ATP-dependent DNA helicase PcrA
MTVKNRNQHNWSEYQKAIFADVASGRNGHLIVEAYAGTGKTSTLIESFKHAPRGKSIIAFAFNKSIQTELEERSPSYAASRTFHSWGFQSIRERFNNTVIDDNKTTDIIKSLVDDPTDWGTIKSIADAVGYCKYSLHDTPSQIEQLIYRFGVDLGDLDLKEFISLVIRTLGICKTDTSKVDFNDMGGWMSFVHNLPFQQYDMVYVDECQDLNRANLVMAKRTVKPNGRIIVFQDPYQSLYSWRASDTTILDEIRSQSTTKTLPLPISYRCPKTVIDLCQNWVSGITCPDTAIDGEIKDITYEGLFNKAQPGCFVLSRTNAPLIKVAMRFIREGKPCNIRGRDIGKSLAYLIKKSKKKRVDAFLVWLAKWKEEECKILIGKGISIENILDRYECLSGLCEECKTLEEVLKIIDEMFNEKTEKELIICSTVHRAKGLERDDVFALRWTFRLWLEDLSLIERPNEEANIAYVCASRAKKHLYLVRK